MFLHLITFLTTVFGSLETTNAGHLSSLIDEIDGERDKLLLPEELIDSVTDLLSVGEIGKSSLQAVAMFYVDKFSICFGLRYRPSTSIYR
jgi:hypothetical protein